jgi:CheY-like chemotaxis protein
MDVTSHRVVILVVEDEPFVRMMAVDALIEHGMTVLEADCVEEALEVIQAEARIDLLFTDINMPGDLDGLDLAEIAHRRQPDLKLIVTSGGMNVAADDIPDHGVFIPKPYDTRALAQMVEAKLSAPR